MHTVIKACMSAGTLEADYVGAMIRWTFAAFPFPLVKSRALVDDQACRRQDCACVCSFVFNLAGMPGDGR
jgi:hypothetical protein